MSHAAPRPLRERRPAPPATISATFETEGELADAITSMVERGYRRGMAPSFKTYVLKGRTLTWREQDER